MTLDGDILDIRELLLDDLRERHRERIAGHTLAVLDTKVSELHADVTGLSSTLAQLTPIVRRLESRVRALEVSRTDPKAPKDIAALMAPQSSDDTGRIEIRGEFREVLNGYRWTKATWQGACALAVFVAACVSIYAGLSHK